MQSDEFRTLPLSGITAGVVLTVKTTGVMFYVFLKNVVCYYIFRLPVKCHFSTQLSYSVKDSFIPLISDVLL